MKKIIAKFFLNLFGWKAIEPEAPESKCLILGAPHTSILDFPLAWLYYVSVGGKASVMVKGSFFFWPLGPIIKAMGGIPVKKSTGSRVQLITSSINAFNNSERLHLAIAVEGTRKPVEKWKAGFHKIATEAKIPVYLGYFDWKTKTIGRGEKFELTDNATEDLKRIRQWYKDKGVEGKYPAKFLTGSDLA